MTESERPAQNEQPAGGCGCGCQPPGRGPQPVGLGAPGSTAAPAETAATTAHAIEQSAVPAQTFQMGDPFRDGKPADGEHYLHEVTLDAFQIDATSVTNADFAAFVDATGYRTEAESFEFSAVFHLAIAAPRGDGHR